MKTVKIYSTPTCTYCQHAKEFMKSHNVPYEEFNVAADQDKRKEMIEKSGQMGVPVIEVDGDIMVGYEEAALSHALFGDTAATTNQVDDSDDMAKAA